MPRERDDRDEREEQDEDALAAPGEATFWRTYSPRFEMPISYVVSALAIASGLFLITLLMFLAGGFDEKFKPGLKIGLTDGSDADGEGQTGGGPEIDPKVIGDNTAPTRDEMKDILPDLEKLDAFKADLTKSIKLDDPNSTVSLSDSKATAYAALDQQIRDRMIGAKKGDGTTGKQGEGGNPTGKGDGTGSDSTRARTLRWVIAFKTLGGRDYLDQLKALGAKVIVPTADGKGAFLFRSLDGNPPQGKLMTEADWNELSGLVQFSDYTALSRQQVGESLGMGNLPKGFWAFFPKELEKELARKEIGYQQRRSEDIDETKFECVNRGGKYELVVTRQTLKR